MIKPTFHAQFSEDDWLWHSGLLPETGTYVDCGANDPFIGNNCAFLRDMGWDGLSIDALDYSAQYASIGAKFIQAVVSNEPEVTFFAACNPSLARICEEGERVKTRSLCDLTASQHFTTLDLLSLDLEGGEYSALMSGMWLIPPRIIISEWNTASIHGGPDVADMRVHDYLLEHGYDLVHANCSNHIFLRK